MPVNYVDIIISVLLGYGLVKGFENGLIKEVIGIIALISGLYIAINFSFFFESKINQFFEIQQQFIPIITFVLLFFATVIVFKLFGHILYMIFEFLALGFMSKLLGSLFGVLKMVVILSFLITMAKNYDLINKKTKKESMLFNKLEYVSELIIPEIHEYKQELLKKTEKNKKKIKESIKNLNRQ